MPNAVPLAKATDAPKLCAIAWSSGATRGIVRRTRWSRRDDVPSATQRALHAGANERALEKAKSLPADSLILDLEDLVAPEGKVAARDNVCAAVKGGGYGRRELVIRVNAIETPWGMDDLKAAAERGARCHSGAEGLAAGRYRHRRQVAGRMARR